jgi:hypothetical protein
MLIGLVYHVENILLSRTLLHHGPTSYIHLDYMRRIYNHLKKKKNPFSPCIFFLHLGSVVDECEYVRDPVQQKYVQK